MSLSIKELFRKEKIQPSAVRLILAQLTVKQLDQVSKQCLDWRSLSQVAAMISGRQEHEILKKVAKKLRLELLDQVPILNHAEEPYQWEFYRNIGAIPVPSIRKGMIACVDPFRLKGLLGQSGVCLALAPWQEISKAIDDSEKTIAKRRESELSNRERSSVGDVLSIVRAFAKYVCSSKEPVVQATFLSSGLIRWKTSEQFGELTASDRARELLANLFRRAEYTRQPLSIEIEGREWNIHPAESAQDSFLLRYKSADIPNKVIDEPYFPDRNRCSATPVSPKQSTFDPHIQNTPDVGDGLKLIRPTTTSINEASQDREGKITPGSSEHNARSPLVFIVEDNPTFVSVLTRYFQRLGIETRVSRCVKEALEMLSHREVEPDLIISDFHMPGGDGVGLLEKIRRSPTLAKIPVVMLTSDESADAEISAIEHGADGFVCKGEDPRILIAHVQRILRERGATLRQEKQWQF
ncbi:MAG: response regulator [Bdellovibrionales bacterium]|nr:response regulator [Bdellovibrionales bacterium]